MTSIDVQRAERNNNVMNREAMGNGELFGGWELKRKGISTTCQEAITHVYTFFTFTFVSVKFYLG